MVSAAPAVASIESYNELVTLDPEAIARASEIEWALRSDVRRNPADLLPRIGLIQALMHQGKAEESLTQSEIVWPRRAELPAEMLDTFQAQLLGLGLYDKGSALFQLLGTEFSSAQAREYWIAFNTGDFARARKAASYMDRLFLDRLQSSGMADLFSAHQAIIRDVMFGKQVFGALLVLPSSGSEGPELAQHIYMAGTYAERSEVEQVLFDRLDRLYFGTGIETSAAWETMTPMLMDVRSRSTRRGS